MVVKIIFLLSVCFRINAQNLELPVSADYTSIQIRALHHEIKIQEAPVAKIIISGIKDKSLWSFKKDSGGSLVMEQKDYDDKLFAAAFEGVKEKIIIRVPMMPLLVTGTDLDLTLDAIKNTAKVMIFKGTVKGFKTSGELRLFLNAGDVSFDMHTAPLFINGSQVKASVKNSSSDIKLNSYSGSVVLEKNSGHTSIFSYQGNVQLQQVTGSSQIELSRGTVSLKESQGRHDIVTDEVTVDLKATKESDFNVKMKNGKLNYSSAGVGGVWLNLNSKEGDIYLPAPMKPQKVKAEVFYKGRTSGEKTAARLEVKSVNAPIIVR